MSSEPSIYGRYILLNKIAVGGMAEVHRAKSFGAEGFEKLIAIKRLYPHLTEDTSFVQMFINEAKLAATLNHVNTVPIYDFGLQEGLYFIAMEYVRGCDLATLLSRCREYQQHIPLGLAIWILIEICNGLDYAHRKHDDMGHFLNLVHRDITPQNILISYEGEVKITDFGIAKVQIFGRDETTGGVLKGKFSYMSPEQVRGDRMDHRSDIFSLGVVAWEMLTCEKMFDGPNDYVILEKVRESHFIPLQHINPDLPPELDQILMKALTRYPEERYASVAEMRLDLLRFLSRAHLFPSRAHLSAFIRKLFEEQLERDSKVIMEETRKARRIHAQQLAAGQPLHTPAPSTLMTQAPSASQQVVEVLAGAPAFSSPHHQAPAALFAPPTNAPPSPFLQPPAKSPDKRLEPLPSGFPKPPHLAAAPFHLQINPKLEQDEPTLPDVQGIEEEALSSSSLSKERPTPQQRPVPPPISRSIAAPPARQIPLQDQETQPPERPWLPASSVLEMQEEENLFASHAFLRRKYTSLVIGISTFGIGLLLLFLFAQWLLPSSSLSPARLSPQSLPPSPTAALPPAPTPQIPQRGRLVIQSEPWAYLYLNRNLVADTKIPFEKEVEAGEYTVTLLYQVPRKPTQETTRQYKIVVKAGKTQRHNFRYP